MTATPTKYKNKLTEEIVEAMQFRAIDEADNTNYFDIAEWVVSEGGHIKPFAGYVRLMIETNYGPSTVLKGDYLVWDKTEDDFVVYNSNLFESMHDEVYDFESKTYGAAWIELIASVCHEANIVIQIYAGDVVSPTWELAPDWQKSSARDGVLQALEGKSPEELHQSWCDFKVKDGWRYGANKDEVAKTHPCLVPYAELPEVQKLKDGVFSAIVGTFQRANLV